MTPSLSAGTRSVALVFFPHFELRIGEYPLKFTLKGNLPVKAVIHEPKALFSILGPYGIITIYYNGMHLFSFFYVTSEQCGYFFLLFAVQVKGQF